MTGSGRGIGKQIALACAHEGAKLTILSRSLAECRKTASEARRAGASALVIKADVSNIADVERAVRKTLEEFGRIDVLINNAGILGPVGPLTGNDFEHWSKAIEINLIGTVAFCKTVIPVMKESRNGKIINLLGGGTFDPRPRFSSYATSKAAIARFTETLAEEVKEFNIQVNGVSPGPVGTRVQDEVLSAGEAAGANELARAREAKVRSTPASTFTDLIVFLASDQSGGLTGRLISAVWDDWRMISKERIHELERDNIYTLRRIDISRFGPMGIRRGSPSNATRGQKLAVVGLWHLGTVISACMAEIGHRVVGFDSDVNRVKKLSRGEPPIYEPQLGKLISKNLANNTLSFVANLGAAVRDSDFVFLAIDTSVKENGAPDTSMLYDAIARVTPYLKEGVTVVVSSQVPVGTCEKFISFVRKKRPTFKFGLAYVPENLKLGNAVEAFMKPDMVVVGSNDLGTQVAVASLYEFTDSQILKVNLRTAEMVKHTINSYLATQISFINEISNLCAMMDVDATEVAQALRLDRRISPTAPLRPGLGFSGGTLARDVSVLRGLGKKLGQETKLLDGTISVNRGQNKVAVGILRDFFGSLQGTTVGILGLTYKAGTSVVGQSTSLGLIRELVSEGAKVKAYDPKANMNDHEHSYFKVSRSVDSLAKGCDALVLVTDWPEFRELDFKRIRSMMKRPIILDAQNFLDRDKLTRNGFTHLGIGRGPSHSVGGTHP